MKKFKLLYALLFAVAVIACKDDDESPTFKKADFIGTWEVTKFEAAVTGFDGACKYTFTETELDETFCDGSTEYSLFSGEYTFDNKSVLTLKTQDADDIKYTLTISSLNATTGKFVIHMDDHKYGTATVTKK
jgi:hypothetical protein